jgi:hypothetical protein
MFTPINFLTILNMFKTHFNRILNENKLFL